MRPAPPLGAMVRSQPELLLRAMSESVAAQWQRSMLMLVAYITTREHRDIPGQGSLWGLLGCPGVYSSVPAPH